jgi:hypothetical protein
MKTATGIALAGLMSTALMAEIADRSKIVRLVAAKLDIATRELSNGCGPARCDPRKRACSVTCETETTTTWSCDDPQAVLLRDSEGRFWCAMGSQE